jgi:hypothetical protein
VKEPATKVVSFDLDNEHTTSIEPLPNVLSRPGSWHLTEVRGRLGIAFSHQSPRSDKIEVWVMEPACMAGQQTWSRWYSVQTNKLNYPYKHYLTQPNFTQEGEYVLTMRRLPGQGYVVYKHNPSNGGQRTRHVVVEIDQRNQGTAVAYTKTHHMYCDTFAYVETTEPLSAFRCW